MFVRAPLPWATGSGPTSAPAPIMNIDFAPTLLALAGYTATPTFMDGVPFLDDFKADGDFKADHAQPRLAAGRGTPTKTRGSPSEAAHGPLGVSGGGGSGGGHGRRRDFLIEYWPIPQAGVDVQVGVGSGTPTHSLTPCSFV